MRDIACGKQHAGLEEFATSIGAAPMHEWRRLGLYDPTTVAGWGEAFNQVVNKTIADGGKIHFNLDDVDVPEALRGDPDEFVGRYTEFELQQVTLNYEWFVNTIFYLNGQVLSAESLAKLGITAPSDETPT